MRSLLVSSLVSLILSLPANAKIPEGQVFANMFAYALTVQWNHANAGFAEFSKVQCIWTEYKYGSEHIFICHGKEKFLKTGKTVTDYFFIRANGKPISAAQARRAAERGT